MSFTLNIWTVYNHPLDLPDKWVARCWVIDGDGVTSAAAEVIIADDLMTIRDEMARRGLSYLPRFEADDPVIFECWI